MGPEFKGKPNRIDVSAKNVQSGNYFGFYLLNRINMSNCKSKQSIRKLL